MYCVVQCECSRVLGICVASVLCVPAHQPDLTRYAAHWEQNRYLVTDAYPHLPLLPMEHAERHKIDSSKTMAVEEFVSYVDTWSAMNTWRKSSPEAATAALAQLKQEYDLCACCVQMSVRAVRPRERACAACTCVGVFVRATNECQQSDAHLAQS